MSVNGIRGASPPRRQIRQANSLTLLVRRAGARRSIRGPCNELRPQRFVLPPFRESKSPQVNLGIVVEEGHHLVQHIVIGRYDIEEILDDTYIIVYSAFIRRERYPRTNHTLHIIWDYLVYFIPNARMMATSITS